MYPRRINSIEPTNLAMVYRTCRECLMEVSWPMKQTSLTECPYCATPYQRPERRERLMMAAKMTGATILVFMGVVGIVGLMVRIGSLLFL